MVQVYTYTHTTPKDCCKVNTTSAKVILFIDCATYLCATLPNKPYKRVQPSRFGIASTSYLAALVVQWLCRASR